MKLSFTLFLCVLATFLVTSNYAQTTDKKGNPWKFKTAIGFSYFEGNVEKLDSRLNIGLSKIDSVAEYVTSYQFVYGELNKNKNNLIHDFRFTTDFLPYSTYSPFAGVFVFNNIFKGFRLRNSYLAGVKRTFYKKNKDDISLSTAVMYDILHYGSSTASEDELDLSEEILRFSVRPKLKFYINDHVVFKHISFWQPKIDRIENFIFTAETSIDFLLKKNFSFGVDYLYYFNSEPPYNSVRKRDQKVLFSLKYSR